MKITFISEDHPRGLDVDWPAVPRVGDNVSFRYRGGTNTLRVMSVEFQADGDGVIEQVEVNLKY